MTGGRLVRGVLAGCGVCVFGWAVGLAVLYVLLGSVDVDTDSWLGQQR